MKKTLFTLIAPVGILAAVLLLDACQGGGNPQAGLLQARVDSLQKRLDSAYAPGLGEFMSDIQVHHAKLWFAGKEGNWPLADFEVHEIGESLDDINEYCKDRPEVASLPMIRPPLDSLEAAIKARDAVAFKHTFLVLTQTCNTCHQATQHGFNVIKVPDTPPFSNQQFGK